MSESRTVAVTIRGRVQGVGFRAWVHHQAELHGLKGWVRNRPDGTVEAVLSGEADLVQAVLKACHSGPRGSRVEAVDLSDASEEPAGAFEVRPTA
jgi:acylphosphatase